MRVATPELRYESGHDIGDVERGVGVLLADASLEHHLEKQIAELLL